MQTKLYGKERLLSDLKSIGNRLQRRVDIYLIGGCAMALKNLKRATKDVDAIFKHIHELRLFERELTKLGYSKEVKVREAYKKLGAFSIMRNPKKAGFDLFHMKVCDMLALSDSMVRRAQKYGDFGNLGVFLLSNEDIVTFKAMTERPRDIDDIAAIVKGSMQKGAEFDWNRIKEECVSQAEHLKIEGHLYNRFLELFEKYQIRTPLLPWLRKRDFEHLLAEVYEIRREEGFTHEEILEQFRKDGFSKREIAKLESFVKGW